MMSDTEIMVQDMVLPNGSSSYHSRFLQTRRRFWNNTLRSSLYRRVRLVLWEACSMFLP